MSSNNHAVAEERELSENVYPNGDYVEASSLLEQVFVDPVIELLFFFATYFFGSIYFMIIHCTGNEACRPIWVEIHQWDYL